MAAASFIMTGQYSQWFFEEVVTQRFLWLCLTITQSGSWERFA
jgi:hypothetical protein